MTQHKTLDKATGGLADESVMVRWSRRKHLAQRNRQLEKIAEFTPEAAPLQVELPEEKTDADMPPIESIDERSNLADFFSPKVSKALRKQALGKLFHLPVFNITDGLNDYDEDYTHFVSLGKTITAEMRHRIEQEAKRLAEGTPNDDEVSSSVAVASTEELDEDEAEPTGLGETA